MLAGCCLAGAQTQLLDTCPLEIIEIDTVDPLQAVKATRPVQRNTDCRRDQSASGRTSYCCQICCAIFNFEMLM